MNAKRLGVFLFGWALGAIGGQGLAAEPASPYYEIEDILLGSVMHNPRDAEWRPGEGIAMEASGLAFAGPDRLAIAIRKGEVWMLDGVEGPADQIRYTLFASGLDEPLGLLWRNGRLLVCQRTEVTELVDRDGDQVADAYLTVGKGWHVSGNYHGYAYGPVEDDEGRLWVTLNLGMGAKANNDLPWRGWGLCLQPDGTVEPMCAGMRSPCGLGRNRAGDVFFTDQQGNWIPTNSLHHLRRGAYYGNPEGMKPAELPGSPVRPLAERVDGEPYPLALAKVPQLVPPSVWFPYEKMGRSRTGIAPDNSRGLFGPFQDQLLIGEFTTNKIGRVFLEKVNGNYQGACFPFLEGFPCAVLQTAMSSKGTLVVGMSNRGWSSLGTAAYGLQRVRWSGRTPFEVLEMRARADGFELIFTDPVDSVSAGDVKSYRLSSYTYLLQARYGGEEILTRKVTIRRAEVSSDGLRVRLLCEPLRRFFVHELDYGGVRSSRDGTPPWHDRAFYTLNEIPGI